MDIWKGSSEDKLRQEIDEILERNVSQSQQNKENQEQQWQLIKTSLLGPSEKEFRTNKDKKEDWMTDEILKLMNERRKYKAKNNTCYKKLQSKIRIKIREAKETYFSERYNEIEELRNRYDNFNLHKKVKELAGFEKKKNSNILLDKEGNIIMETEKKLRRWEEYIEELFHAETGKHGCRLSRWRHRT
ncbi:unnamed protein product [Ceutorhynchus assimilis]|uniref:Uncharacterized protein n=1 Tax=Ceutorhynchus assimilis TaxID=467358 RepID=A0A9N9MYG3_9CUCU|nr:unnamed protein product [Ceutorhynchus assimilis]